MHWEKEQHGNKLITHLYCVSDVSLIHCFSWEHAAHCMHTLCASSTKPLYIELLKAHHYHWGQVPLQLEEQQKQQQQEEEQRQLKYRFCFLLSFPMKQAASWASMIDVGFAFFFPFLWSKLQAELWW
jgi:hypothetical protein